MKPERARELFSDYAEDALTPALRLAMDQHFEADADARADYADFARVYAVLESDVPEMVDVPLGFRAGVLEKVAAEQAQREAAPVHRAALSLTGWWRSLGTRRVGAGAFAALAACAVVGVIIAQHGPVTGPNEGKLVPGIEFQPNTIPTTITGVNYGADASGSHYNFVIHLPVNVPKATVSADILTSNDQIADADERVAHATPALAKAQTLTNDESMEIPVTLPRAPMPGTTLNMWVQWAPSDGGPSDSEVVFTPAQPVAATPKPLPDSTNFYDALQYVAAANGVSVIADAQAAPTQIITPPTVGATVDQQLQSIAAQVGGTVQKLSSGAYDITLPNQ